MNGDIVGRIEPSNVEWYLLDDGQCVTFHKAFTNKERTESVVFYANNDTWPIEAARDREIEFTFIRNATQEEAMKFILENNIVIEKIIEV